MRSGLGAVAPIRLPLNSKRLTVGHLRRLASALEVPTGASADEIRQMIDGKLSEAGLEVPNVQVILPTSEPGCEFSLEDEEGKFLTVPAIAPEGHSDHSSLDEQDPPGERAGRRIGTVQAGKRDTPCLSCLRKRRLASVNYGGPTVDA